jgi:hypothetical protein
MCSDYLEEPININTSNRWQWSVAAANSKSLSSQTSLSPPIISQNTSSSLPPSPISATFANSAVYVTPSTGLHKSVSVR